MLQKKAPRTMVRICQSSLARLWAQYIILALLAFLLGRGYAAKKIKPNMAYQVREPWGEKPELGGTGMGGTGVVGAGANHATQQLA